MSAELLHGAIRCVSYHILKRSQRGKAPSRAREGSAARAGRGLAVVAALS